MEQTHQQILEVKVFMTKMICDYKKELSFSFEEEDESNIEAETCGGEYIVCDDDDEYRLYITHQCTNCKRKRDFTEKYPIISYQPVVK